MKKKKNSVVEQVMDDLCQEMQSSLDVSSSDVVEMADLPKPTNQSEDADIDSLIYFQPRKFQPKEEVNKENNFVPKKKAGVKKKEEKDFDKVKKPVSRKEITSLALKRTLSKLKTGEKSEKLGASYASIQSQNIPVHITLKQSENLKVAQERIVALEQEIERLRTENEDLIATGDIFRERLDKVIAHNDKLKKTYEGSREEFQDEKKTLVDTLSDQNREIERIAIKNKELEKRLSNNIQHIRVRERELENRLELIKLDSQTLAREKDKYILDLKRKVDIMKMDLDTKKNKHNEVSQKLEGYRSQSRRAIRGLQMALHILRGSDFTDREQQEDSSEE